MSPQVCPCEIVDCSHVLVPFYLNRLLQSIHLSLHVQHVFWKACRSIDDFTNSSVLVCCYHHSCHRSGQTSLLIVTDYIQSFCRSICTRQSIYLHVISFLVRFIGSMLYIGNTHLADDFTYIYVYCTCQHKINHDP